MPVFALIDDLLADEVEAAIVMPIEGGEVDAVDQYLIGIDGTGPAPKKLVIGCPRPFPVRAMVGGRLFTADSGMGIETPLFGALALSLGENSAWFRQWTRAGCIPAAIEYEGLLLDEHFSGADLIAGVEVEAGTVIGTAQPAPPGSAFKLSVTYGINEGGRTRTMHPIEFLSLLFWQEPCDRLFRPDSADEYAHPLLRRLASCRADGSPGDERNGDWLGLRPPLRTYKRIEWEARQTHRFHNGNWQIGGNLRGILRNPIGYDSYVASASKCNILLGELAFRAGFRSPGIRSGDRLYHAGVDALVQPALTTEDEGRAVYVGRNRSFEWDGRRFEINLPFGVKRFVTTADSGTISEQIAREGRAIYYGREGFCWLNSDDSVRVGRVPDIVNRQLVCPGTRTRTRQPSQPHSDPRDSDTHEYKIGHVFLLAHLTGFSTRNGLSAGSAGIDQHCTFPNDVPREGVSGKHLSGAQSDATCAFVELMPGGDPTQDWGVVDLNCLTEVIP